MNLLQSRHRVSTEGRLSQQAYVLFFTLPFMMTLALTASMFVAPDMFARLGEVGIYGAALGWLLLMALGDALNIKRYHDLGHSGRLYRLCRPGIVVLPLLAFVLDFFIPAQMASLGDMEATMHLVGQAMAPTLDPAPFALLALTVVGVTINVVYLSLMPGQAGPNDHGPDPRGGVSVPGATAAPAKRDAAAGEDDPVKRALAAYQRERAATPQAARTMGPATPGAFGKKRS